MGQTEVNAANLPITTLTSNFANYSAPAVTWGQYTGRLGDTTPPASATVYHAVYNASTKASVYKSAANLVNSENNYSGESQALPGLTAKTNYYVEVYAAASGSIPKQVFARRCFMTGGTYTISARSHRFRPNGGVNRVLHDQPPHPAGCPQLLVRAQDHTAPVQLNTGQHQLPEHVGMPITAPAGHGRGGIRSAPVVAGRRPALRTSDPMQSMVSINPLAYSPSPCLTAS